jgi:hypothetical protein
MNLFSVSAWYKSAVGWSLSLFFLVVYLAIALDVFGFGNYVFNYLIPLWLGGGLVLWIIGNLSKQNSTKRVMIYMLIVGVFGYMPLIFTMCITSTGFSLALTPTSRFIFLFSLITVTILWCVYQLQAYRRRIIEHHFMEKEFYVGDDQITMRLPSQISLDAPPITNQTFWGRIYNKLGPYLFLLIPFAYPLQKLVRDESGFLGGLFLMAIFAAPLTIYILGRLTCGAYLYVYKVWQLEHKYGKPVIFNSND